MMTMLATIQLKIVFLGAGIDGGLKAIDDSNRNIKAITVDQSEKVEQGLQDGTVIATITQHPYTQGKHAVEIVYALYADVFSVI